MPYKYIGRTTDFKGKSLWEILGNLKNFGVGRIVGRNRFQRYSEPSYVKILKVEGLPNPEPSYDSKRKCIALVEKTFRGVTEKKLVQMESATYKSDHFLVPKYKEAEFCKVNKIEPEKIFPAEMQLPPILKELIIRQAKANGKPLTKEPKMTIAYNKRGHVKRYRIAQEGETPTEPEPVIGFGKPVTSYWFKKKEEPKEVQE